MSAVTKQEIVEALRQAYDCSVLPYFGPLADRIEQHGIAPQDGWVLVKDKPVVGPLLVTGSLICSGTESGSAP